MSNLVASLSLTIQKCSHGKYVCLLFPMVLATGFIMFGISYVKDFNFSAILTLSENDTKCPNLLPKDILQFIRTCQSVQLVFTDPDHLKCLHALPNEPNPSHKSISLYRFAIMDRVKKSRKSMLRQIASKLIFNNWELVNDSEKGIVLRKSGLVLMVSIMEKRPRYWYLHGLAYRNEIREPDRAFLGLKLVKYELDASQITQLLIPQPLDYYLWQWPRSRFLECNRSASAYVREKYPKLYDEPPVLKDSFVDSLAYCRNLLLKYRFTVMLAGGTALGWYRECGIIPHTTDTDIAFLASEWNPEVEEVLKRDPVLRLSWILGTPNDGLELTVHVQNSKIDINALYEEGNRTFVGAVNKDDRRKIRWWYPPFTGACTADLKGHLFYVRCNILDVLIAEYGPEWYEHFHSYHFAWHSSHKNVEWLEQYNDTMWSIVHRNFEF